MSFVNKQSKRGFLVPYSDSERSDEDGVLLQIVNKRKVDKLKMLRKNAMEVRKIKLQTRKLKKIKKTTICNLKEEVEDLDDWLCWLDIINNVLVHCKKLIKHNLFITRDKVTEHFAEWRMKPERLRDLRFEYAYLLSNLKEKANVVLKTSHVRILGVDVHGIIKFKFI